MTPESVIYMNINGMCRHPECHPKNKDGHHYNEDPEATAYFWGRLNNLRYQLHKVKLAKLECAMEPRLADIYIDIFTEKIKLARG